MPAGLRRVVRAAPTVFLIVLAAPGVASAAGGPKCNASACKVYIEPNVPSAGGHQQQQPPQQQPTGSTGTQTQAPTGLSRVLAQAGEDKAPLSHLLTDSGLGTVKTGPVNVAGSSSFGAAFDLGAGPTALLAILLATALGFAVHGPVRGWLRRRSSS
jgi:hypothetical protein